MAAPASDGSSQPIPGTSPPRRPDPRRARGPRPRVPAGRPAHGPRRHAAPDQRATGARSWARSRSTSGWARARSTPGACSACWTSRTATSRRSSRACSSTSARRPSSWTSATRCIDATHGEFWLDHCGALMDVEPMGDEYVTTMCHDDRGPDLRRHRDRHRATSPGCVRSTGRRACRPVATRTATGPSRSTRSSARCPTPSPPSTSAPRCSRHCRGPTIDADRAVLADGWDDYTAPVDPDLQLEQFSTARAASAGAGVLRAVAPAGHVVPVRDRASVLDRGRGRDRRQAVRRDRRAHRRATARRVRLGRRPRRHRAGARAAPGVPPARVHRLPGRASIRRRAPATTSWCCDSARAPRSTRSAGTRGSRSWPTATTPRCRRRCRPSTACARVEAVDAAAATSPRGGW